MGGLSYNMWLRDLCAGSSWFLRNHDNPAQSHVTMKIRHTGHVTTHYMIHHPFDLYFN
jgi:hypothetical protein